MIKFLNLKLFLGVLLCVISLNSFSQIDFRFNVSNATGSTSWYLSQSDHFQASSNSSGSTNSYFATFTFDLTAYGICEGDQIKLGNTSTGYAPQASNPNNHVNYNTKWDLGWGNLYPSPNGTGYNWNISNYILGSGGSSNDGDLWDPTPLTITIPNSSATGTTTTHTLCVAPELASHFFGLKNVSNSCSNGIRIQFIVNNAPSCIASRSICSGEVLSNLIPSGIIASNWSPFDPTVNPVNQTTNFTVTLANSTGGSCTSTCNFTVNTYEPEIPLAANLNLCTQNLPYIGANINDYAYLYTISVNGALVYNDAILNQSYFNSNGNFTITNPGSYTIVQTFYTGLTNPQFCSKTYTININSGPVINLPATIEVCDNHFYTICAPASNGANTYSYSWNKIQFVGPFPNFTFQTNDRCFTPTAFGNYLLTVIDQNGCLANKLVRVIPATPIALNLPDVIYCKEAPSTLNINFQYDGKFQISWTLDGHLLSTPPYTNGTSMPNHGDGTYCVTIQYGHGCFTQDCFEVKQCCEPRTDFGFEWQAPGQTGALTANNYPGNTTEYTNEQWTLLKYCGQQSDLNNVNWTVQQTITRTSNFNTPVVFNSLNPNCKYKLVHRVYSACLNKYFESTAIIIPLKVKIYGNPLKSNENLNIIMENASEKAQVRITEVLTGKDVYQGELEFEKPLVIDKNIFNARGRGMTEYNVKISNSTGTITEKLIVN